MAQQADASRDWGVNVRTLLETTTRNVRPAVWTLFGAVAVVLLIACTNVANLLIAKGVSRRGEIAVRLSLGAGPARVVQQLLTEGLVLAACAAAAALPLAYAGMRILVGLAPGRIVRIESAAIDWRVLLFASAAAVSTVLLFAPAPALETVRFGMAAAMLSPVPRGCGRRW
jgi:ABC-type antimicrobial peptide transport system permease subunit